MKKVQKQKSLKTFSITIGEEVEKNIHFDGIYQLIKSKTFQFYRTKKLKIVF